MARPAAKDLRSILGLNLKYMREETGLDPWLYGMGRIKEDLMKHNMSVVPPRDVCLVFLSCREIDK